MKCESNQTLGWAATNSPQRRGWVASNESWYYPAPIALFTTPAPNGVVNFAQFSFFNVVSENLPPIVLGLQSKPDGSL